MHIHLKLKMIFGLATTLLIIYATPGSLLTLALLLPFWYILFAPWTTVDIVVFIVASLFFLGQNYVVLAAGGFSFKNRDIFLMPYYEPFLWGYYFMSLKRFINNPSPSAHMDKRALLGLLLTGICFSLFARNASLLLLSTILSTTILLVFFHQSCDLYYALTSLILGGIIEFYGVHTGLWSYAHPDLLGIPFWFITMWLSVGLLGNRFLIAFATWLVKIFFSKPLTAK